LPLDSSSGLRSRSLQVRGRVAIGHIEPYPGLADIFYLLEYPLVAVGLIGVILRLAKGRSRDVIPYVSTALAAAVSLGMIAYVGFLSSIVNDTSLEWPERVLSIVYPFADLVLEFAPALMVLVLVAVFSERGSEWQWFAVASGFIMLATTDTMFAWLEYSDLYVSGGLLDIGWMLGFSLVALGASLALDMEMTRSGASEETPLR